MALGEFTKQIAQQALLSATSPKDPAPAPAAPESLGPLVLGEIGAMQRALREDEELQVFVCHGNERIRVGEIFFPNWRLAVLTGHDAERNLTRVIGPADQVQLAVKVVKLQPGAKGLRVALVPPKQR
jgi:hypothetical protein